MIVDIYAGVYEGLGHREFKVSLITPIYNRVDGRRVSSSIRQAFWLTDYAVGFRNIDGTRGQVPEHRPLGQHVLRCGGMR